MALNSPPQFPLLVDMDSTLLATDSLYEGIASIMGKSPSALKKLFAAHSRLELKNIVSPYSARIMATLPLNSAVLGYLKSAAATGQDVYLVTASPKNVALACAERVGIFKGIYASTDSINLKGQAKADFICAKFGKGNFDYIGDSLTDIPVWACARKAIVASGDKRVIRAAETVNNNTLVIAPQKKAALRDYAKALRIRQWAKNFLVFLPMLLAHSFSAPVLIQCVMAFFSLSLCASAIYVVNDICDLDSDRRHPRKKARPFAGGVISIAQAPFLFAGCLTSALILATFLPYKFLLVLFVYLVATLAYSLYFKKRLFLDVVVLATLYVLRIVAGAAASGFWLSNWLLGFAAFFFLGLALLKRAGSAAMHDDRERVIGRAYMGLDLPVIESMAISSGFCAIVIIALYIDSLQASTLYHSPELLWLTPPPAYLLVWALMHPGKARTGKRRSRQFRAYGQGVLARGGCLGLCALSRNQRIINEQ